MKKIIRITFGLLLILCGISILTFGVSLFVQQQSWLMLGGLVTLGGIGFMLIQLGIAVVRGQKLKELLDMLLLIAGGGPR